MIYYKCQEDKNMNIKISTTNSKLGYQIPSISLLPQCSCRPDAPCARGCYGKRGNFTYKQAQYAQQHNYDIYITNCNQRPSTTRLILKMADKNQA